MTTPLQRPHWPRPGASAAIIRGNDVLLIERGKGAARGLWSLPGGHVEPGETAAAAAAREVGEETGIAAGIAGLLDVKDIFIRDGAGVLTAHYVLSVYWGHAMDSAAVPIAASDAAAARYVARGDLGAYRLTAGLGGDIERAFALATASR